MEGNQDSRFTGPNVVSITAELKDDMFFKLIDDFLGSQTGEGLELDEKPCKNRFLVQVGLMRETSEIPWTNLIKWLKKIFPVFQSADFRCLIERNITTALSLTGEARESFLDSDVNFEFVGPICDSIGIGRTDLLEMSDFSDRAGLTDVTNGLILELTEFVSREKIDPVVLVSWLRNFDPQFCRDGKTQKANKLLQSKLKKFRIHYRNYQRSRFRNSGMMDEFLQSPFDLSPSLTDAEIRRSSLKRHLKRKCLLSRYSHKKAVKAIKAESVPFDVSDQGITGFLQLQVKTEPSDILEPCQTPSLLIVKEEHDPLSIESQQPQIQASADLTEVLKVDTGDCLTLLDVSVLSLQKLSSMYGGKSDECKMVSLDLLKNQYFLVLREDAYMKALDEKVTSLMNAHSLVAPLNFLHHNTHFLLDLSDAVEQQMMAFEREIVYTTGEKLGRDKSPKFHGFVNFNESAVTRYIRMACEILCPRKETTNNYRRHWLAFCIERHNPSKLPVNQSNRYINFYEAAAGLVHHYNDAALFFSDLQMMRDEPNIILDSVNDDATDEALQALVSVLAVFYCKILGPYWQLLKSSAQYSHYSRYVLFLYQRVLQWSKDASPLLLPDTAANVFLQVPLQQKTFEGVFAFCSLNAENQYGVLIKACLEKVMKVTAAVIEENLKDFLPGGMYCEEPSLEVAKELAIYSFSFLMNEYPFGHTYPFKKKRPDLSSMPTQNSSSDLAKKSPTALQKGLSSHVYKSSEVLEETISLGPSIMLAQKMSHPTSKIKVKKHKKPAPLEMRGNSPNMDDMLDVTSRSSILATVAKNGGPCTTKQDVDRLLAKLEGTSHAQKREAIRCELSYQKWVLGSKNKHLNHLGFSLTDMVSKLKVVLPTEECSTSPNTKPKSPLKVLVSNVESSTELENQNSLVETISSSLEQKETCSKQLSGHYQANKGIDLENRNKGEVIFQSYREKFDQFPSLS
ncbi:uncharacterized protein LOC115825371 isoform X2 [Chanos chanos]|uniref:Uncharacterized protein LOC115825371 isoform X2 n=1 Tax=Chanos chanos TaxID=29144 RepID=A0A6J2WNB0_CHACN|nr:uncharacterized protein LOC115825371 isoform X2 [Chanos chanos]